MKRILIFTIITSLLFTMTGCSPKKDVRFATVTDIHYASDAYYVYEKDYFDLNDANGSGKQMKYLDTIFDAFIEQLPQDKPEYLLVTGDFIYVGAIESHNEVVKKFKQIEDNGIQVLVIPGNHEMQNNSFICPNDGTAIASVSPTVEEFKELYADYGYGNALSYDPASLSYVYDTKESVRFFMLDTNIIYGQSLSKISKETLSWLDEQLNECVKAKQTPVICGHHNLLVHHPSFVFGYQIGNSDEVVELFNKYNATLYFSGHIHTQSIVKQDNITDITNESFAVWPHRYGLTSVDAKGNWNYESKITDVESYAKNHQLTDENLIDYNNYGFNYYYQNAYNQCYPNIEQYAKDQKQAELLADFAAKANVLFFAGQVEDIDKTYYQQFLDLGDGVRWHSYLQYVIDNTSGHLKSERK